MIADDRRAYCDLRSVIIWKPAFNCCVSTYSLFLVDGNFTEWGAWSPCSQTCLNGTQTRYRNCTNPPSQAGGRDCVGPRNETQDCYEGPCPGWLVVLFVMYHVNRVRFLEQSIEFWCPKDVFQSVFYPLSRVVRNRINANPG